MIRRGYCSITVVNYDGTWLIRFVSKNYTHPWKNFANKFCLVLYVYICLFVKKFSWNIQTRPKGRSGWSWKRLSPWVYVLIPNTDSSGMQSSSMVASDVCVVLHLGVTELRALCRRRGRGKYKSKLMSVMRWIYIRLSFNYAITRQLYPWLLWIKLVRVSDIYWCPRIKL